MSSVSVSGILAWFRSSLRFDFGFTSQPVTQIDRETGRRTNRETEWSCCRTASRRRFSPSPSSTSKTKTRCPASSSSTCRPTSAAAASSPPSPEKFVVAALSRSQIQSTIADFVPGAQFPAIVYIGLCRQSRTVWPAWWCNG